MNPLDEKANTLSRCGSFYYRTLIDDSKADAEFVSHTYSYTRLMALGDKITTAIKGGCYYEDYYKIIKFTDRDIDWNGVKEALQHRVRGGMGAITSKLEYISSSKARELGTSSWVLLKEDVPTGLIDVASMRMQVLNTAPIKSPVFLQVYIIDPEGTAIHLATSTQSVTLAAGEFAEWSFAEALIGTDIYNKNSQIAFQFTTNTNATWQDDDYVQAHLAVGAGAYVPAVQFYKLASTPALPSFNRPPQLTIKDHFLMGDDKWNWISKEGTPQPIAFPGGEKGIKLPETQELIWDLHIDAHIMVTSIKMDDGTMLYANQDFASQFGKLTFLKNPIALFPKMQFMAQSYTGRMPNLYNYLVRADELYGSVGKMMNYMRGAQSIKSFYHASAQAAGLAVIEKDCTVVAVSPLLEGKLYITTAGRYEANYPHTPLNPGTKLPKDYIIGGNQLYRLIGPYDPIPSNVTGINLDAAVPVPGLFAPNKEIVITDEDGNYRPDYIGDASALQAYYTYIDAQQKHTQEPNKRENGMQHFRYTACPNRCVVACINEGYMTAQMKLRLMTYLQRELPIGSVLVTANLSNIVNEFQSPIDGIEFVLQELNTGLNQLVGAGNYEVAVDSAGDKLVVHTDRISDAEAQAVTDLIERVVPYNIVVERYNHNMEISWRDINKYAACKTRDDVVAVNPDYINDLTSDGEWVYPLPEMTTFASNPNGDWWAGFFFRSPIKKIKAVFPKCTYCHAFFGGADQIADADVEFPIATRVSAPARSLYKLKNFRIIAPLATTSDSACYWNQCKNQDWYIYYPKTTDMTSMFQDCREIEEIKGEFGAVATTMANAFYRCYKLRVLDIKGDFGAVVTNLNGTFYSCSQLSVLDLKGEFGVKATTLNNTFYNCTQLSILNINEKFGTKATTLDSTFYNCSQLSVLDLNEEFGAKSTNCAKTFYNCSQLRVLNLKGGFGTKATTLNSTFYNCIQLSVLDLKEEFGILATDLDGTFYNCTQLRVYPTNYPNASTAKNMFGECQLSGEAAIAVLNSLPSYVDEEPDESGKLKEHHITMGIHKDYENDPDVLAALDNATAKRWTIERQWNGVPTSPASTFGFTRIWVHKVADEQGEYVDPNGLRCYVTWCHALSTPDGSTPEDHGYELYRSVEAAMEYWGLQLWVEPIEAIAPVEPEPEEA